MINTQSRYTSRSNRPKKPNMNKLLNILIGVVVILIVITAGIIFFGNDEKEQAESKNNTEETALKNESTENDSESAQDTDTESKPEIGSEEIASEDENAEGTTEDESEEESSEEGSTTGGSVTSSPSDDPVVSDTIANTAWEPVGTSQTGEHVSIYSKNHVDWNEKVKALAYATGLSSDNMIVWHLGNGGSPQKSIGTVSSKNKEEKYRVYLHWVDGEGWRPEKMDTLKTLDGAY
ncbi:YrrS family protein [Paenisporosarcina indica]|uniref:YrrS family protein n=1 Tax=Paenisporosarcina indica TaxID=650093 RepID=UPI00095008A0|nr:YrrS family protein [Paenisporosarcina indica]